MFAVFFMLFSFNALSFSMLRLKMNGLTNSQDETVVYYQSGATDGFDSEYDAYKLFGPNPAPHISQEYNSVLMSINGIESVAQTFSISLKTTTHITGTFTISASDFAGLPNGTCVYLNDLVTGATVNILAGPYTFTLSSTTSTSRFVLSITHFELPIVTDLIQPSCLVNNGGKFKVTGTDNAPWNYVWKDSLGTVVKTSLNSYSSDSLDNLTKGYYTVEISAANNNCYYKETTFAINEKILAYASFTSPDTIVTSISENYMPENQSINCETYSWNFGDGTSISTDFEPSHSYSVQGLYEATLIGTSSTGCQNTASKFVRVIDVTTFVIVGLKQNVKLIDNGDNTFNIKLDQNVVNELSIDVIDMGGRNLLNEHKENLNGTETVLVDLSNFKTGIYALNIGYKDKSLICSKIVVK